MFLHAIKNTFKNTALMQIFLIILCATSAGVSFADELVSDNSGTSDCLSMDELVKLNGKLLQRIENLEKRVIELENASQTHSSKEIVKCESEHINSRTSHADGICMNIPLASDSVLATETKPLQPSLPNQLQNVQAKSALSVDGYIKLDAIYSDSTDTPGSICFFVPSEAAKKNDSKFYLTVNQTRFGVNFLPKNEGEAKYSGRLEYDFYGGYNSTVAPENKSMIMLRHAYVNVEWPDMDLSLLGGQTWDVIAPLNPNTVNYGPMLCQGNIGYRRPQLRLTKGIKTSDHSKLTLQLAAVRTLGKSDVFLNGSGDGGIDSGKPSVQGRLAWQFPATMGKNAEIGVFGHSGEEEHDVNVSGDSKNILSRSSGFDFKLPVSRKFSLQFEGFSGQNIDTYYGGIYQGILVTTRSKTNALTYSSVNIASGTSANSDIIYADGIKSKGGWLELNFGPYNRWHWNAGIASEKVTNDELPANARVKNTSGWLNTVYDLNNVTQLYLEYARCTTTYRGIPEGSNNRIQSAIMYKF
ncbi:MAG: hypothetical protein HQM10_04605 [Candidatus Riflebacteria bacterium]|nr:hypothetical protein [Candidatus Riflebacteria bacterium]